MREILFRGKRIDNGDWVYGYYAKHETRQICPIGDDKLQPFEIKHLIVIDSFADWSMPRRLEGIEVILETIGQYTGMIDRNGNKIFEEDKVAFVDFLNGWETECIGEVIFSEYGWHFTNSITESNMHSYEPDDIEIIGNIHDEEK